MGRSTVSLQTESKTNRTFVAIRIERNGKTSYPKVYFRTKNEEVALSSDDCPRRRGRCG
jgi:hypothetical protein